MPDDNPTIEPVPEDATYPETLRITIQSGEDAFDAALDDLDAAERGEQRPATVSFETAAGVRRLLTDRRLELLRSLMTEPAESITALAKRLDRNYAPVHEDIEMLEAHGIVKFRQDGRAKQPFVPYETIEFDVTIRGEAPTEDTETPA
jgi:predicted transcriptional regulator